MKGQEFGNYVVRAKIGEGGMGEVFLAEHRRMGRRAAVKVLRAHGCANPHDVERFFNEARAASIIDHPGVVQIFDCDFHENVAYLIMEYLEGESLATMLRRTRGLAADPEAIATIGAQIANVLGAAHGKGIVHRDLKPDNVFLEVKPGGARHHLVRLLDFGIAKLTVADAPGLTKSGTVLGTPTYMAPEQCAGDRDVDARADIYSLGCILFEMATGSPPFVRAGAGSLITAHMSESPPSVNVAWAGAPEPFVGLVAQMLAKDPAARPQTMAEVEERLRRALALAIPKSPPVPPAGDALLATTVSLATQPQAVETEIDPHAPRAAGAGVPVESRMEDSLPGPTVSLPTGHRRTGDDHERDFLGKSHGRRVTSGRARRRKKLPVLLAGAVAALGIALGLLGTRRNSSTQAPRSVAPGAAVVRSAATVTTPPTVPQEGPLQAPAPPTVDVEEKTPTTSDTVTESSPAQPTPKSPRAGADLHEKPEAGKTPRGKTRSASSRRIHSKPPPAKEIRGFSDF